MDYPDHDNNDFQIDFDLDPANDIADATRAMMEKTPSRFGTPGPGEASITIDFDEIERANNSLLSVFDPVARLSQTHTPARSGIRHPSAAPNTRSSQITYKQFRPDPNLHRRDRRKQGRRKRME